MSETGKVKKWLADKGFGFITGSDGVDIFCHARDLGESSLIEGLPVTFDVEDDRDGKKKKAVNVRGEGCKVPEKGQYTGTCRSWIHEKGFGFIKGNHSENDVFVHFRNLVGGDMLYEGGEVYYNVVPGDRDPAKLNASEVTGPGVIRSQKGGKGKGDPKGGWGGGWGDPWGGAGAWGGGWAAPPGGGGMWGAPPAPGAWGGAAPAAGGWGGKGW
eukprot:TRINITY_DN3319_c2_g1_i1.p2 TRINITY_DN3319_c2_g1~~TRINITY_DN3319_c2_g1_i1.p2  ORF type:complete len:242 (+),score=77.12 TRINITY_DN3319_c2_g1_i1:87-728(+)